MPPAKPIGPIKPKDVDQYLESGCGRCKFGNTPDCKVKSWTKELTSLRSILRKSGLTEEIKWSAPCYTHQGRNILTLSALKDNATISFFRGAELSDPENVLQKPGENSRFARYILFTNATQIASLKKVILDYIQEAVEIESSGKKASPSDTAAPEYPDELNQILEANPEFRKAFAALTPGRQRGYLLHFSSAKQSTTRTARIEKCMDKIFEGKGWNER